MDALRPDRKQGAPDMSPSDCLRLVRCTSGEFEKQPQFFMMVLYRLQVAPASSCIKIALLAPGSSRICFTILMAVM